MLGCFAVWARNRVPAQIIHRTKVRCVCISYLVTFLSSILKKKLAAFTPPWIARSLHPPVVVGHYLNYGRGGHRFVPSSPAPIRLSLDFFPRYREIAGNGKSRAHRTIIHRWEVVDCHGGLVLLREISPGFASDLVVCDPLSRRYRDIHHPPIETAAPNRTPMGGTLVFLLDGGDDDGNISLSNFRVLYCSDCFAVFNVYSFSAADGGEWRLVRQSWKMAAFNRDKLFYSYMYMGGAVIGRIDRSLYLAKPDGSVSVLDNANARLVLVKVDLPTRLPKSVNHCSTFAVVHGASPEPMASPATASIVHVRGEDLELFRRIPSSGEWVLEHSIPRLSEATRGLQGHPDCCRWWAVDVIAGGTRLAVLRASVVRVGRPARGYTRSWLFSLDVDTMQLQVVPDPDVQLQVLPDPDVADTYPTFETNLQIYTLPWPQFLTAP